MNYEQYQRAPAPEQNSLVNQARGRIENSLRLGPEFVNTGTFFKDVYLLDSVGFLNTHFDMLSNIQRAGAHPKVRGEFVKILQDQDSAGDSKEVLATLAVGQTFDYHREPPFQTVFAKLAVKHEQLIAEARRQASNNWPPPESNAGKSPEWVAAQEKIARLWENVRQRLPQGIERETQEADIAYFQAGFGLLKEEMSIGAKPLIVRAMLEYLIPQIWRQPRLVENFLKGLEAEQRGRRKPTTLKELAALPKGLFIPLALHNQDSVANKEQSVKIRSGFRTLSKALHTDIANNSPDVNKNLQPYIELIHKAVNNAWPQVQKNVLNFN